MNSKLPVVTQYDRACLWDAQWLRDSRQTLTYFTPVVFLTGWMSVAVSPWLGVLLASIYLSGLLCATFFRVRGQGTVTRIYRYGLPHAARLAATTLVFLVLIPLATVLPRTASSDALGIAAGCAVVLTLMQHFFCRRRIVLSDRSLIFQEIAGRLVTQSNELQLDDISRMIVDETGTELEFTTTSSGVITVVIGELLTPAALVRDLRTQLRVRGRGG